MSHFRAIESENVLFTWVLRMQTIRRKVRTILIWINRAISKIETETENREQKQTSWSFELNINLHGAKMHTTWKLIGKYVFCVWFGPKATYLFGNTFNCISHCIQFSINIAHTEPETHSKSFDSQCNGSGGGDGDDNLLANRVNKIPWIFMPNVYINDNNGQQQQQQHNEKTNDRKSFVSFA